MVMDDAIAALTMTTGAAIHLGLSAASNAQDVAKAYQVERQLQNDL